MSEKTRSLRATWDAMPPEEKLAASHRMMRLMLDAAEHDLANAEHDLDEARDSLHLLLGRSKDEARASLPELIEAVTEAWLLLDGERRAQKQRGDVLLAERDEARALHRECAANAAQGYEQMRAEVRRLREAIATGDELMGWLGAKTSALLTRWLDNEEGGALRRETEEFVRTPVPAPREPADLLAFALSLLAKQQVCPTEGKCWWPESSMHVAFDESARALTYTLRMVEQPQRDTENGGES